MERLPELHRHLEMRLTKLFPTARSRWRPNPHRMQQGLRQAPPMQPNTEPWLSADEASGSHRAPRGSEGGRGGGRAHGGVRGRGQQGGAGRSNRGRTRTSSAHLPKQRQPLSNLRTNLIVFFINTRVISLQDKPLLGFFTFFIF